MFKISVFESSNEEDDSTLCEPVVDGSDHSDDEEVVVPIGDETDDVVDIDKNDATVDAESWPTMSHVDDEADVGLVPARIVEVRQLWTEIRIIDFLSVHGYRQ